VDSGLTGQIQITFSAFVKNLKKRVKCDSASVICTLQFRKEFVYNFLIEFGILMKLLGLIKMCLNETYITVQVG